MSLCACPYSWRICAIVLASLAAIVVVACATTTQSAPTPTQIPDGPPPVRSGQEIFASICAACHGTQGQGQSDWHIPNPDGTMRPPPLNGDGHTWHHSDGHLYRIVQQGGKIQEDPVLLPNFKSAMPAFGAQLDHEEIIAVITYIKSLWKDKTSRGLSIRESQANASIADPFPDG